MARAIERGGRRCRKRTTVRCDARESSVDSKRVFSNPRIFYRVLAGAIAFGWVLYVVSGGSPEASRLGMAKIVPVLLSVLAIWAAMVEEEAILWTMGVFLVLFGFGFSSRGALLVVWAGVGLLLVAAVSRNGEGSAGSALSPDRRRQIR